MNDIDDEFQKLLNNTKIIENTKKLLISTMDEYNKNPNNFRTNLIDIDGLFEHISYLYQEKFDEEFTDAELTELNRIYGDKLIYKWYDFISRIPEITKEGTKEWLAKNNGY